MYRDPEQDANSQEPNDEKLAPETKPCADENPKSLPVADPISQDDYHRALAPGLRDQHIRNKSDCAPGGKREATRWGQMNPPDDVVSPKLEEIERRVRLAELEANPPVWDREHLPATWESKDKYGREDFITPKDEDHGLITKLFNDALGIIDQTELLMCELEVPAQNPAQTNADSPKVNAAKTGSETITTPKNADEPDHKVALGKWADLRLEEAIADPQELSVNAANVEDAAASPTVAHSGKSAIGKGKAEPGRYRAIPKQHIRNCLIANRHATYEQVYGYLDEQGIEPSSYPDSWGMSETNREVAAVYKKAVREKDKTLMARMQTYVSKIRRDMGLT